MYVYALYMHRCLWICGFLLVFMGCEASAPQPEEPPPKRIVSRYVGDEACASCHEDLYAQFHQTGMGRSLGPFDPETAPEKWQNTRVYNKAFDLYYEAFLRGDTLYQREFRLNRKGEVIHELIFPVAYVVGSGNATRSYLMEVNGFVTEMPLTWYVHRQKWDLSPGYEQQNFRFNRPIDLTCMTCHNGKPGFSAFTINHYTRIPDGIACERCHGPGGQHVDVQLAAEVEGDTSILNPARLSRGLQMDVCEQCHLTGIEVFKPGENPTTYEPGKPLAAHRTVFVPEEQLTDPEEFGIASHALRLAQSACFKQSSMTCTTCHDPHVPVQTQGLAYFSEQCQTCHRTPLDVHPKALRPRVEAQGECITCHMQKGGTRDIPHVYFTDHWIRRTLPKAKAPEEIVRIEERRMPMELVALGEVTGERPVIRHPVSPEEALEWAIAYFSFYETRHALSAYLPRVVRLAREGFAGGARHPEAYVALGRALIEMDSLDQAVRTLQEGSTHYPGHAWIWYWQGVAALRREDIPLAIRAFSQARNIQPLLLQARIKLATALQMAGREHEAIQELEAVVRADSVHHADAWNNLGFLYLQTQKLLQGQRALERAVQLDPDLLQARINLASVYILVEKYPEAIEQLAIAIEQHPAYIPAYGNLGIVYLRMGEVEKAREMFQKILELDPENEQAKAFLNQLRG